MLIGFLFLWMGITNKTKSNSCLVETITILSSENVLPYKHKRTSIYIIEKMTN